MPNRRTSFHVENCWKERVQAEQRAETAPAGRLAGKKWHHYAQTGLEPDDIEGGSPLKLVVAEIYRSGVTTTVGGDGAWRERLLKEVNLEGNLGKGSPEAARDAVEPPWFHAWCDPDDRWTRKSRGFATVAVEPLRPTVSAEMRAMTAHTPLATTPLATPLTPPPASPPPSSSRSSTRRRVARKTLADLNMLLESEMRGVDRRPNTGPLQSCEPPCPRLASCA